MPGEIEIGCDLRVKIVVRTFERVLVGGGADLVIHAHDFRFEPPARRSGKRRSFPQSIEEGVVRLRNAHRASNQDVLARIGKKRSLVAICIRGLSAKSTVFVVNDELRKKLLFEAIEIE